MFSLSYQVHNHLIHVMLCSVSVLQVKSILSQSKYSSTGFLAGFLIALGVH